VIKVILRLCPTAAVKCPCTLLLDEDLQKNTTNMLVTQESVHVPRALLDYQ